MKIFNLVISIIAFIFFVVLGIVAEVKSLLGFIFISGLFAGIIWPWLYKSIEDMNDTTSWKVSQRKLMRAGEIKKDTLVRISFAYLYRIKIGNRYLLVKNARNTGKYQPVGGVYKFKNNERIKIKNLFNVVDDNKIPIDRASYNDYRLQLKNKFLRKFINRFDQNVERENIYDLGREFKEELIDTKILDWSEIEYRVCGRDITNLHFSKHFQIYEILIADIIELQPTKEQREDLLKLADNESEKYRVVTSKEIKTLGVDIQNNILLENIADHSQKILQENENNLIKIPEFGECYTVELK